MKPKNLKLYELAMRHKSAARNLHHTPDLNNERLEFLGDAVLDAAIADHLYKAHPRAEEGELTRMKSRIVSRSNLNRTARRIGVDRLIETDLQATNSRESIAGNALEALFGAMYLDLGYDRTKKSILYMFDKFAALEKLADRETDFKSRLYEEAHKRRKKIHFTTVSKSEGGSDRGFDSTVFFDNKQIGTGEGGSKKKAEQAASREALQRLGVNGE